MTAARRRTSASSSRSRSRRGGRGSSSSQSSPAIPLVITGVSIVVIAVIFAFSGGGDGGGNTGSAPKPRNTAPADPKPATPVKGTAKAGKTPDRPAPEITQAMFAEWDKLLKQAKGHYVAYQRLHLSDDQEGKMIEAGKARDCLQKMSALMDKPLEWWDEADFEDWAMPAAYSALAKRFQAYSTLNKKVRLTGI